VTDGAGSHDAPCVMLPWDSRFFGVTIARLVNGALTPDVAAAAMDWCGRHRVDCLYALCESGDAAAIQAAEQHAFGLVDIRLTLEREGGSRATASGRHDVRNATPADIARLRQIASAAHTSSRFYFDDRFPRERCDELYATWIERSCEGAADAVLVAEHGGVVSGYLTCETAGPTGSIGLVGVSEEARGRGVGSRLVSAATEWFDAGGLARVRVVTQGRNVAAQALYQRHGFRTSAVQLWYHRWFPGVRMQPR
jgi:dTDP-4-amino-4,6-dideoxy-D-galactose acyltransferase